MDSDFNETYLDPFFWSMSTNSVETSFASFCCISGNARQQKYLLARPNVTAHLTTLVTLRAKINNLIIPVICLFGVIGNMFSIYVFSRRWLTKYMDQLERSASAGLISLALSDLSFCLVSLPALFLRVSNIQGENNIWNLMTHYYNNYRAPLTNLFLLNSTWIIVMISLERFIAVSYAIKARWIIRVRVTLIIHATVFLSSFVICLPLLLRNRIHIISCPSNFICYYVEIWSPLAGENFKLVYKAIWTSIGTFIPLLLLVLSCVRLLVDLYRSKAFGLADPDRYCTPQITTMVAAILLTFITLVCPSMIIECLHWNWFSQRDGKHSRKGDYYFWQAVLVANLLQAIKFASNFLLYCAVSREFRKNFNFRRLRDSFMTHATRDRKVIRLHRETERSSASACQLIALQSHSRTSSHEGKDIVEPD